MSDDNIERINKQLAAWPAPLPGTCGMHMVRCARAKDGDSHQTLDLGGVGMHANPRT
jgi:hypothetical protein